MLENNTPKVSIILPIYNVEQYLDKCIESILKQSFKDFELILVNDGSPDKSNLICQKYASKDSRIIIIDKENGGVSSARNAGLNIAQGEYIWMIDPDDFIAEKALEKIIELAEKFTAQVVIFDFKVYINDTISNQEVIESVVEVYNDEKIITAYQQNKFKYSAVNKLYCKKIIGTTIFDEEVCYGEDVLFNFEIMSKLNKVVKTTEQLYHYFIRDSGVVRLISKRTLDALDMHKKVYELADDDYKQIKKQDYINSSIYIATQIGVENSLFKNSEILRELKEKVLLDAEFIGKPKLNLKQHIFFVLVKMNPKVLAYIYKVKYHGLKKENR